MSKKNTNFTVTKANGEVVPYNESKLRVSLQRAGANADDIHHITYVIGESLYNEIPTGEIYKKAFQLLKRISNPIAAKYSIKKALLDLGPSGYPFEHFVGQILKHHGFKVEIGIILNGKCVSHEIDVLAEKENHHYMVECKFHNQMGRKCDVKIPLYINSRFQDVVDACMKLPGHKNKQHQGWIVTNTRFTDDAEKYGTCIGLRLLSWDYPKNNNLRDFIDRASLHPVTCLTTISRTDKQKLLDQGIVLCKDLIESPDILRKIGIPESKVTKTHQEAELIVLS